MAYGKTLLFPALVVPFIRDPLTSQPIDLFRNHYKHLQGMDLADTAEITDSLEIDLLIGSDVYWSFVTGKVIRGIAGHSLLKRMFDGFYRVLSVYHVHQSILLSLLHTH